MTGLTIGEVAVRSGTAVDTIRFYEREGLVPEPARRPSGYRDYPPEVIDRLNFIRRAKSLGFSLKEVAELLSLRVDQHQTRADVLARAEAKMADIDAKLRHLSEMKMALARLIVKCNADGPTERCPILASLESDDASMPGGGTGN